MIRAAVLFLGVRTNQTQYSRCNLDQSPRKRASSVRHLRVNCGLNSSNAPQPMFANRKQQIKEQIKELQKGLDRQKSRIKKKSRH
jgi:hypothetical protein